MLFGAIVIALVVALLVATIEHELNYGFVTDRDGDIPPYLSRTGSDGWQKAAILGIVAGLARAAAGFEAWAAVGGYILMIGALVYLAIWWWQDGDRLVEAIMFLILGLIFYLIFAANAAKIVEGGYAATPFGASVITVIPQFLGTGVTGFILVTLLQQCYARDERAWQRVLAWVLLILFLFSMLSLIIWGLDWGSLKKDKVVQVLPTATATPTATPTTTPAATPEPEDEEAYYYFFNTEMIADDDPENDWNFGSDPLILLLREKVANGQLSIEDVSNKSMEELFKLVTPEELVAELRVRMSRDPALGAAVMAWCDAKLGTRYLGVFYDEVEGAWDAAMNKAKEFWMTHPEDYNKTLAAFWTFLDQAVRIEIVKVKSGLNDQMYQNPFTKDHVPDIIVRETKDHSGYFLRFVFLIKEQEFNLEYRINCGFQPTNVAKVMNITPTPVVTPTPTAKPTPTPSPSPSPTPTPEPTPEPTPTGKPSGGDPDPTPRGKPSGGDPDPTPTARPTSPPTHTPEPTPTHTPEPTPTHTPEPTPEPTPTHTPEPTPTHTPEPTPEPTPKPKDPTKGSDVGGNDDPGPGPDTNTGVGGQKSSEDLPTNSDAFSSYEEYKEEIQELKEANEEQRVGGENNEPSYNPPPKEPPAGKADDPPKEEPPTVHSNAEEGTGNGGIDLPSTVDDDVIDYTDPISGEEGDVAEDDPPRTEWGGPPD